MINSSSDREAIKMERTGIIYGINGPIVYLKGDPGFKMNELVYVGTRTWWGSNRPYKRADND